MVGFAIVGSPRCLISIFSTIILANVPAQHSFHLTEDNDGGNHDDADDGDGDDIHDHDGHQVKGHDNYPCQRASSTFFSLR